MKANAYSDINAIDTAMLSILHKCAATHSTMLASTGTPPKRCLYPQITQQSKISEEICCFFNPQRTGKVSCTITLPKKQKPYKKPRKSFFVTGKTPVFHHGQEFFTKMEEFLLSLGFHGQT
jgi:hypothetical protein